MSTLDLRDGYITSLFGSWEDWRRDAGLLWHAADDYRASLGTEILAPDNGEVVYSGFGWGTEPGTLGYYTIFHGPGYGLLLAHQDRAYPHLVRKVRKGEVIGISGNTGWTTGPHLHAVCSVKQFSNGWYDYTREGGGVVSPRFLLTGAYSDPSILGVLLTNGSVPETGGAWARVTKRLVTRGEWCQLSGCAVETVSAQVAGQWRVLGTDNPEFANAMFPSELYGNSAVFIKRRKAADESQKAA